MESKLKPLLVCKVWANTTSVGVSGSSSPSGALNKIFFKKHGSENEASGYGELLAEEAKLLCLTCDSIAVLDPLVASEKDLHDGKIDAITYALSLSQVTDVKATERQVSIQYVVPRLLRTSDLHRKHSFADGNHKTFFGTLTAPTRLASNIFSKKDGLSGETSFGHDMDFDDKFVEEVLVVESSQEAIILKDAISTAIKRMKESIEWLEFGLPFDKSASIVSVVLSTKSQASQGSRDVVVSDVPVVGKSIEISVPQQTLLDQILIFSVASPFGLCRGKIDFEDVQTWLQGSVSTHRGKVKASPIRKRSMDQGLPNMSVDLQYTISRAESEKKDLVQRQYRDRFFTFALVACLVGILMFSDAGTYTISALAAVASLSFVLGYRSSSEILHASESEEESYCLKILSIVLVEEASTDSGGSAALGQPSKDDSSKQMMKRQSARFESMKRISNTRLNLNRVSVTRSVFVSDVDGHAEVDIALHGTGTVKNLSEEEALTLGELNKISKAVNVDLFERYIAACKGDRAHALTRLRATAEWRAEHGVDSILSSPIPYFKLLKSSYVHAVVGRSRDGLPVVVEGMGKFKKTMAILRKEGVVPERQEEVIHQFVFVVEWITRILDATHYPQGKFLRIYDMKGIGFSDIADSEAVHLGKQMMEVLEQHYPERMSKAYVLNVPGFFGAIWRVSAIFHFDRHLFFCIFVYIIDVIHLKQLFIGNPCFISSFLHSVGCQAVT